MRFERRPRAEGYTWTSRKEAAYLQRHKRVAKRIERDIPLFADQYAPEPETDIDAEKARREKMAINGDQSMRDLEARHWRKGRAAYFACSPEIRARISAEWNRWTGPLRGSYFIYVLEKHTGEAERRRLYFENERRVLVDRLHQELNAQTALPL
jgi:hypothetical protein